jgi:hypothetical protein
VVTFGCMAISQVIQIPRMISVMKKTCEARSMATEYSTQSAISEELYSVQDYLRLWKSPQTLLLLRMKHRVTKREFCDGDGLVICGKCLPHGSALKHREDASLPTPACRTSALVLLIIVSSAFCSAFPFNYNNNNRYHLFCFHHTTVPARSPVQWPIYVPVVGIVLGGVAAGTPFG